MLVRTPVISAQLFARAAAGVSVAIGTAVLTGWWLGAPGLVTLPGLPPVTPNCAAFALLSGCALALAASPGLGRRRAGRILGGLILFTALLTVAEHVLGRDLGIDHLLVTGRGPRPSLNTALGYVAFGSALVLVDARVRGRARLWQACALVALLLATITLLVFAYGTAYGHPAHVVKQLIGMSLHTAVALTALVLGLLAARPREGVVAVLSDRHAGGQVARRLLPVAFVMPVVDLIAVLAQRAGHFPPPGAAAIGAAGTVMVAGAVVLVVARSLNASDRARRAAEADLMRWKQLFDDAAWGALASGPDDRIVLANPALASMLGFTTEQIVGRPLADFLSPDARQLHQAARSREDSSGHYRFELDVLRGDGTTLPVLLDARAVRDPNGSLVYRSAYLQDIREARQAQEARARLAALVESSDDAIIGASLAGEVLAWNAAAERLYGWSAAEMTGRSVRVLCPPERAGELDEVIGAVRQGGRRRLETVRVRKDGSRVEVAVTTSPIVDAAGRVVAVSAITRDITERREAEGRLREAHATEQRLRQDLEALSRASEVIADAVAAVPETRLDAALRAVAEEARRLVDADRVAVGIGADSDERTGTWVCVGCEAEAAKCMAAKAALAIPLQFHGREVGQLVLAGKRGGGAFSAHDERVAHLLAHRAASAIAIATVYQREAIERAWLHAVIDQMTEAVVLADAGGRITLQNRAAARLSSSAASSDATDLVTHDLRLPDAVPLPASEHPLLRALRDGQETGARALQVVAPDGEVIAVLVSAAPVTVDGEPAGAVMVMEDIRALKELERLREEWTAMVAHDLRQPLNVISIAAQMIGQPEESVGAASDRDTLVGERIRAGVTRLQRMIEDLKDGSRLHSSRLVLERQEVQLAVLVREVVAELPDLAGRCSVEVGPGAERAVWADSGRVTQVVSNLLVNAVKYGDGGPIGVVVARAGDALRVTVENGGAGISADELPTLFDRFVRGRGTRPDSGLGLGLYIARGLIEAQGGRIWAESTPGQTTSFHFTLPLARVRELERARELEHR